MLLVVGTLLLVARNISCVILDVLSTLDTSSFPTLVEPLLVSPRVLASVCQSVYCSNLEHTSLAENLGISVFPTIKLNI